MPHWETAEHSPGGEPELDAVSSIAEGVKKGNLAHNPSSGAEGVEKGNLTHDPSSGARLLISFHPR